MVDSLTITDLELWTRIGVHAEERAVEQRLLVTIEMTLDTRAAAQADDVKHSINYFDVTQALKALAEEERKTIERFAEDIAGMILKNYSATEVTVSVKKFALPSAKDVHLVIRRSGK